MRLKSETRKRQHESETARPEEGAIRVNIETRRYHDMTVDRNTRRHNEQGGKNKVH